VPRAVVWWLLPRSEQLTEEQQAFVERSKSICPKIQRAQSQARDFFALTLRRDAGALEGRMARVEASGIVEQKGFVAGLRRDWEAS
jgi:hypothetical protein